MITSLFPVAHRPRPSRPVVLLAVWLGLIGTLGSAAAGAEPAAGDPAFAILEFRVQGNTLLPARTIEATVYPFLGPGRTIETVNAAAKAVETAYRDAGYPTVFVDVPEQNVGTAGVVRLKVTEGRIERVRVTGARYYDNGWIRDQLPEARPGAVPQLAALQGQLKTLNQRSPDRSIDPILRPGQAPGTVEVEFKVKDQLPLHGTLEVNNRNTVDTTPTRLNASLRYDNLWQRDHSLGLQYQVSPEDRDETEVFAASYLLRPKASRNTLAFYAVDSKSEVATFGGDISVLGPGNVFGSRFIMPLVGREGIYPSVVLGVDYKDFKETIAFADDGEEDIQTPVSYFAGTAGVNSAFVAEGWTQNLALAVNLGLGGSSAEFANKRFDATPNYIYVTAGYDISYQLPAELSLFWSVTGQVAPEPLISNEQFGIGGADSVRGYYEAEELGDYGVQTTVELRSPNLGPGLWARLELLQAFVFGDWANVGLHDELPGEDGTTSLASTGVGLNLAAAGFLAGVDWALPLRDGPSTEARDDRVLFSVQYGF